MFDGEGGTKKKTSLTALKEGTRTQSGQGKRTVICMSCQKPGHFAGECREDYAAIQPQLAPAATQPKHHPKNQGNGHPLNHKTKVRVWAHLTQIWLLVMKKWFLCVTIFKYVLMGGVQVSCLV